MPWWYMQKASAAITCNQGLQHLCCMVSTGLLKLDLKLHPLIRFRKSIYLKLCSVYINNFEVNMYKSAWYFWLFSMFNIKENEDLKSVGASFLRHFYGFASLWNADCNPKLNFLSGHWQEEHNELHSMKTKRSEPEPSLDSRYELPFNTATL